MNDKNQQLEQDKQLELAPLDDFERQWVDQLAHRDPDLPQTEDAFVQSVLQSESASAAGSPTVGRIGFSVLPFAAAAAILLAAFVGWYVLNDTGNDAPEAPNIANQPNNPTQPDDDSAVASHDKPKVELGRLIAKATTANPTAGLTNTVSEMPETLSVDRLFDLLDGSVPDLKEILAPLDQNKRQSRA